MKQSWQKAVLPHVYAVLIFLGLSFIFCSPVLQGLELRQNDTVQWQAMSQEARAYHESTGIEPIWTNAMFGGMPTYQIYMAQDNYTYIIHQILTLGLPKPVNFYFLAMAGFYLLLCVMRFRNWIAIIGAVAFGFTSYNAMIISAGHDTKMFTIAYMAPMLAGILLAYRGKFWLGGIITGLTLCLMITSGHYQILYYMLLICLCVGIGHLVYALREKQVPQFIKATVVLLGFGILSVLPSTVSLWTTAEYSKYTMRGGLSELTPEAGKEGNKSAGGLDKDYAFQWSQGPFETLTILAPNLYGGSTMGKLSTSSETYKTLSQLGMPAAQAEQFVNGSVPLYWGPQPMTDGGVYWGAVIIFLFVLALFIIKSHHKWWVLAACVLGVFLAWGDHFAFFNYFIFDHLPLYNKFRAPAQALIIPQLLVPFLACWALNDALSGQIDKQLLLKQLKKALYITGGLCLLLIIASYGMLDFTSATDRARAMYQQFSGNNQQITDQLMNALIEDRSALLRTDAFRTLAFVLIAAVLLWAVIQQKLKPTVFFLLLAAVVAVDQIPVDFRYLNKENYVTPTDYRSTFAASPVDEAIKKDPDPYYRVLNVVNFQDALSSYHHKAVGGYSPVKLALYQDLIDHQLSKNNPRVLNMLNTKYVIYADQQQQLNYQRNPDALGNAWFVDSIVWAANADQEMKALDSLPVEHAVVIDQRFKPQLEGYAPGKDSSSRIQLTQYGLNQLAYQSQNSRAGFAVFSDIYYPAGWNAYVDGKKTEIIRVNYLLRGIKIPAGEHKVEMKFEPRSYYLGNTITRWSSILMMLLFAGVIAMEIRKSLKSN